MCVVSSGYTTVGAKPSVLVRMRSNDTNKIIVVGIPKSMEDDGLNALFHSFGSIVSAKVVKDGKAESRGFGFVSFTSSAACKTAIKEMDRKPLEQRVLNVRHVVPKEERRETTTTPTICWKFKKGLCTAGKACEYSHQVEVGAHGTCFEFLQHGKCKRGDKCKFSHLTPEGTVADPKKNDDDDDDDARKPQRVCFAFQKGTCHRGSKCMFAHETLKPQVHVVVKHPPEKDLQPESKGKLQLRQLIEDEKSAKEIYRVAKRKREYFEKELKHEASVLMTDKEEEEEGEPATVVLESSKVMRKHRKEAKKKALQRLQASDTVEFK